MVDQWYFEWDNKQFGPFSATQLRALAALGRLQPCDAVWKENRKNGVRADRIKNLFPNPLAKFPHASADVLAADEPFEQVTPAEQQQEQVARVITEQDASASPPAASAVLSTYSEKAQEPVPETSPILVTDPKLKDRVSSHGQLEPPKKHLRKGRAIAVQGAVIISQNGEIVQYKKKCGTCGFEEASRRTMPIRPGITKETLFCPKCSKRVEVVIQGMSS